MPCILQWFLSSCVCEEFKLKMYALTQRLDWMSILPGTAVPAAPSYSTVLFQGTEWQFSPCWCFLPSMLTECWSGSSADVTCQIKWMGKEYFCYFEMPNWFHVQLALILSPSLFSLSHSHQLFTWKVEAEFPWLFWKPLPKAFKKKSKIFFKKQLFFLHWWY